MNALPVLMMYLGFYLVFNKIYKVISKPRKHK